MILWLDTTAGVAGDMILGSLLDAGADLAFVQRCVDAVAPDSVRLATRVVNRQGQRATKLDVEVIADDVPHRHWSTIRAALTAADLPDAVRTLAHDTFARIAVAEGKVHGVDPEQIHFHEVGALDSIADVVGSCAALVNLGVERVVGTPIAVGVGHIQVAHGQMSVPVAAVAEMATGWPTMAGQIRQPEGHTDRPIGELATPTGIALVRTFAETWGPQPAMITHAVGVGAGAKDTVGRPNVVRAVLGEAEDTIPHGTQGASATEVAELEANVDDLDPRLWPGVVNRLLEAGALDAWLVPIIMKKGRPAHTLHVLTTPDLIDELADVVLATTTTLGVRWHPAMRRRVLDRQFATLTVRGRQIAVKVAERNGRIVQAIPEFDDVARAASALGISELDALTLATAEAGRQGLVPGHKSPKSTE